MNYYPSPGVQQTIVGQDKQGYYAASPGYPAQAFPPGGLTPGTVGQPGAGMPSIGQHQASSYGQPSQAYAMAYSGSPVYSALSSAAYGSSMPPSLGTPQAAFQGLGGHPAGHPAGHPGGHPGGHPAGVPSTMAAHISVANSLPYQQASTYSQPTYIATPIMTSLEQPVYNPQFSSPMYQTSSPYAGYPGVQMQQAHPSYPNLGYSAAGLASTRGLNPSYPGAMGFVPRYSYK
ncbi:hypothetical protein SNE40_008567 [Patella caerulea]|uniref:Uncharacterized protein n=1 Tax=Patella caerulea TaxID=87958 RepID=A0AAN8K0B9_PATCE